LVSNIDLLHLQQSAPLPRFWKRSGLTKVERIGT
jgi:hypothetical protein